MSRSMTGDRIAVFGAGGHIGRAVVEELARQGAQVWLLGRRAAALEDATAGLRARGSEYACATVDATDRAAVERAIDQLTETHGAPTGVFNAVGLDPHLAGSLCQPSVEVDAPAFLEYMQHVVWSQFLTASVVSKRMLSAGRGSVVLLTATPARGVAPWMAGHSAGHAAIEGLVRALAAEWSPAGLRVNGVRSGGMPETPRIQAVLTAMAQLAGAPADAMREGAREKALLRRMPTLRQTAAVVAFLLSDTSASLTGAILNASCGEVVD